MKIQKVSEFPIKRVGKWAGLGKAMEDMGVGDKIQVTLESVAQAKIGQVYVSDHSNGHKFTTQIVPSRKNVYLCVKRTK